MCRYLRVIATIILMMSLSGCAFDVLRIEQIPSDLRTDSACPAPFSLGEPLKVELSSGYTRVLKQGTRWECVGALPQGDVFRTKDQVLTVEASNIYEANIVVSSGRLVGFYLPVEKTFTPLEDKPLLTEQTVKAPQK